MLANRGRANLPAGLDLLDAIALSGMGPDWFVGAQDFIDAGGVSERTIEAGDDASGEPIGLKFRVGGRTLFKDVPEKMMSDFVGECCLCLPAVGVANHQLGFEVSPYVDSPLLFPTTGRGVSAGDKTPH